MGSIPNDGGILLGDQSFPSKNLNTPIWEMAGIPLANIKKQIRITDIIDAQADIKNIDSISFSKNLDFILSPTLLVYFIPFNYFTYKYRFYIFNW